MSKKDPATQRAIENYEKLKLKIKEKLTSNPKLWDHFKERISMYGDYEDIIWKDIITNLMMVYNWRVPPSLSSNDGLNRTSSNITCGWEFVDTVDGDTEIDHEIRWFNVSGSNHLTLTLKCDLASWTVAEPIPPEAPLIRIF